MAKVLCIVRSSTEAQEIESQKKELIEFCKTKGFADGDMLFIEAQGASARSLNKKYIKMLEDIKSTILNDSEIKSVAVWALNRLGRVESKLHEMKEFFVKNRIQVYCKDPSFSLLKEDGTEDTAGSMMFSVYAAMVKLDTEEMFAKMQRGKKRNAEIGKCNGSHIQMYGYQLDSNNFVIPLKEEAEAVNMIYDMYISGKYSTYTLATELNERGFRNRGKKVTQAWIGKILGETAYIGYTNWEGSRSSHRKFIPIMSKEKWDKCQAIKEAKKNGEYVGKTKESRNTNLGCGLIKCPKCGGNYMASGLNYLCYHKKAHLGCENSVSMRINVLDQIIYEVASILHIEFMSQPNNNLVEQLEADIKVLREKIMGSEKDLKEIDEKKAKIADIYVDGIITKKQYQARIAKIDAEKSQSENDIDRYKVEIGKLERQLESAKNPTFDNLLEYADDLSSTDIKKMKDIVNQHISKVWFDAEECNLFNGKVKTCKHIHIIDENGKDWEWIYISHLPWKGFEKKLYKLVDGKMIPHWITEEHELLASIATYQLIKGNGD